MKKSLKDFLILVEEDKNYQLDETAQAWINSLVDTFKNVYSKLSDAEKSKKIQELIAKFSGANLDQEKLKAIKKAKDQVFPNLKLTVQENIIEGEVTMDKKKTNLDMFLEGIESVEVSKKPKFHSIHRLYEAKEEEEDEQQENKECNKDDKEKELDEVIVNEKKDDEEEGEEHEADETEGEEEAENEAGDKDEEGGKDEEPETDSDEEEGEEKDEESDDESDDESEGEDDEEDMDEAVDPIAATGAVLDMIEALKNAALRLGDRAAGAILDRLAAQKEKVAKMPEVASAFKKVIDPQTMTSAAKKNVLGAATRLKAAPGSVDENEMDEGAQGYAAGLKGVRKDAGAKHLKSGTNKVPTPKVNITGDKKLLKKPTTLKGDTYPKSSVAGAARPGAPKVKKS